MSKCMLTERVRFQELKSSYQNDNGFDEEKWEDIYTCWANKRDISGKEFLQLGGDKTELVTSFTVRSCNIINSITRTYETKKYRIIYNGLIYNIIYPYDVKNEHRFIDFKCKLVK